MWVFLPLTHGTIVPGRGVLVQKNAESKSRTLPGRLHAMPKQVIYGARGTEILPDCDTSRWVVSPWIVCLVSIPLSQAVRCFLRRFIAHPGELALAEAFGNSVQARIAESAAKAAGLAEAEIKIFSTVHTDIDMFIYSQPTVKCTRGVPRLRTWHSVLRSYGASERH